VAYYLRELGRNSIILEKASHVAPAASGKSGGFLAREWGSGPTVQLHQKGFDLHVEVAKKLGITSFR
jgi:glycine/D-amino acid oxidase-like deaminating enzyme